MGHPRFPNERWVVLQKPPRESHGFDEGFTLAQLQAISDTSNLGPAWDLGTMMQLPAIKLCILNVAMTGCASPAMYGALLAGQR